MKVSISVFLPLTAFVAMLACSEPPPPPKAIQVVIGPSARIGGVLLERAALVIEGDTLISAGAQADVPIPAGSTKFEMSEKHLVDVPEIGQPATFTVLICNPEPEPACKDKVFRHMKAGKWID